MTRRAPGDQRRGDIKVIKSGTFWILDVGIICPGSQRLSKGADAIPGKAAAIYDGKKTKTYSGAAAAAAEAAAAAVAAFVQIGVDDTTSSSIFNTDVRHATAAAGGQMQRRVAGVVGRVDERDLLFG
jgi:hypothetical protein